MGAGKRKQAATVARLKRDLAAQKEARARGQGIRVNKNNTSSTLLPLLAAFCMLSYK